MRDERRKNILDFIWWIKKVVVLLSLGEVAEWSIAAVLKTVELRGSGGSNPSLSADFDAEQMTFQSSVFVFGIIRTIGTLRQLRWLRPKQQRGTRPRNSLMVLMVLMVLKNKDSCGQNTNGQQPQQPKQQPIPDLVIVLLSYWLIVLFFIISNNFSNIASSPER